MGEMIDWKPITKWLAILAPLAALIGDVADFRTNYPTAAGVLIGITVGIVLRIGYKIIFPQPPKPPDLDVHTSALDGEEVHIRVGVIPEHHDRSGDGKTIGLSWSTLIDGAEALCDYVDLAPGDPKIEVCIGVNTGGLILANYVATHSRYNIDRDRLGVVMTVRDSKAVTRSILPALHGDERRRILVVDSQLKSGDSLQKILDHLTKEYQCKESDIFYVALIACGVAGPTSGRDLSDLLRYYEIGDHRVDRGKAGSKVLCVAYVTSKTKVKLPGKAF